MRLMLLCVLACASVSAPVTATPCALGVAFPVAIAGENGGNRKPPKGITAKGGERFYTVGANSYVESHWYDDAGNLYKVTSCWPTVWESNGWLERVKKKIRGHRRLVRQRKRGNVEPE